MKEPSEQASTMHWLREEIKVSNEKIEDANVVLKQMAHSQAKRVNAMENAEQVYVLRNNLEEEGTYRLIRKNPRHSRFAQQYLDGILNARLSRFNETALEPIDLDADSIENNDDEEEALVDTEEIADIDVHNEVDDNASFSLLSPQNNYDKSRNRRKKK
jgi:hypothetical protein